MAKNLTAAQMQSIKAGVPTSSTRQTASVACGMVATLLALAGCTGASGATTASPSMTPGAVAYSSTSFAQPFDVALPEWLPPEPTVSTSAFVTWETSDGARKIRVLKPVSVYVPGDAAPTAPPTDFRTYLEGLAKYGATITDESHTPIGGNPAVLLTLDGTASLDGSLGCPEAGMAAPDCYGVQPENTLRLAAVDVSGSPLLIWLRTDADYPEKVQAATSFDEMLASLKFPHRPVVSQAAPADTSTAAPSSTGRIVFRRSVGSKSGALFVSNPDGSSEIQVTQPVANTTDGEPSWSPDGETIVFTRFANLGTSQETNQLFTVAADGSGLTQLTTGVSAATEPIDIDDRAPL